MHLEFDLPSGELRDDAYNKLVELVTYKKYLFLSTGTYLFLNLILILSFFTTISPAQKGIYSFRLSVSFLFLLMILEDSFFDNFSLLMDVLPEFFRSNFYLE